MMESKLLFRLVGETLSGEIARAWKWLEEQHGLALIYCSRQEQMMPYASEITFVIFDMSIFKRQLTLSWMYSGGVVEMLQIMDIDSTNRWIVVFLELQSDGPSYHLVVRQFLLDMSRQRLDVEVLLDVPAGDMASLGPLYGSFVISEEGTILYRKPADNFRSGALLHADHINLVTKAVEQTLLGEAESALAYFTKHEVLVLALNAQEETGLRFQLSSYSRSLHTRLWQTSLVLRLVEAFVSPFSGTTDLEWLGVNASLTPFQLSQEGSRQTWVLGVALVRLSSLSGHGHDARDVSALSDRKSALVWLDEAGHEMGQCRENLGLQVQVCQLAHQILGVDLLDQQWRLWRWNPQQDLSFQRVEKLDQAVLRVHLCVNLEQGQTSFWLLEEFEEGLRITQRDVFSFREITSPFWFPNHLLLEPQNALGSLNWYTEIDAFAEKQKLLFFCRDEAQQLVLYQIE